jgi:DNA polymerase elongation subunit (family B)
MNEDNQSVCVRVENFTPYLYIELPSADSAVEVSDIVKDHVTSTKLIYKHSLYNYSETKKPFLFCSFESQRLRNTVVYNLKNPVYLSSEGSPTLLKVHEYNASAILQMASLRNIPMSGWINFNGKLVEHSDQITSCDREYITRWKSLTPSEKTHHIDPKVLSFDIEVNSENMNSMPDNRPDDAVFQISCVFHDKKILLTLGKNVKVDDVDVRMFENEEALLEGFINVLTVEKPNVITGYNILGFDIPYLTKRYERYFMIDEFKLAGYNKVVPAKEQTVKWSSSAYKNQEFQYIDWEGIILIDLLPIVRRDYKMDNYKLHTIATHFLDAGKDPVTHKDIFKAYQSMDPIKLSEVGKYCVKDSDLVLQLINHLHCWVDLSEMSKVCNVEMFTLYTKGQQIKIYSQVYKYCLHQNIVVDSNGYEAKANEQYTGAYVFDPEPGYYENVVPLDFSSLYPSIIIAYNICYSTCVTDPTVPDNQCHVFEWEDHVNCDHDPVVIKIKEITDRINIIKNDMDDMRKQRDKITHKTIDKGVRVCDIKKEIQKKITKRGLDLKPLIKQRQILVKGKTVDKKIICAKRYYRFYKKEIRVGVIPTIIQNQLLSRKNVKLELKNESDPIQRIILDKKQLAYKVAANSMYGAMGVRRGLLPFMPGAMCVTYTGRTSIGKVADIIVNKWKGDIVYGDTDSNYVRFPHITDPTELWDYAIHVASKVSAEFPAPMKLEFENAIYVKFLILSKKRYMYQACDRSGVLDPKIGKKGVLLARRDNSGFIRNTYEKVVNMIFDKESKEDIEQYILDTIHRLFEKTISNEDYIITKSIGNSNGDSLDEEGKLGDYKVKPLSDDVDTREKQLKGMTEREYYLSSCPAQVQLADRMKRRGIPVDAGSRIEYVVLKKSGARTQGQKIEDFDYFSKRTKFLTIDPLYYLQSLINPFDQILAVVLKEDGFMDKQHKIHVNYGKVINELNTLFSPRITVK